MKPSTPQSYIDLIACSFGSIHVLSYWRSIFSTEGWDLKGCFSKTKSCKGLNSTRQIIYCQPSSGERIKYHILYPNTSSTQLVVARPTGCVVYMHLTFLFSSITMRPHHPNRILSCIIWISTESDFVWGYRVVLVKWHLAITFLFTITPPFFPPPCFLYTRWLLFHDIGSQPTSCCLPLLDHSHWQHRTPIDTSSFAPPCSDYSFWQHRTPTDKLSFAPPWSHTLAT